MIPLNELLSQPWVQRVGWTLVHVLWQGLLIAGLLWVMLCGLRRRSAQVRYVVACAALVLLAALPAGTFFLVQPTGPQAHKIATGEPLGAVAGPETAGTAAPDANAATSPAAPVVSTILKLQTPARSWAASMANSLEPFLPHLVALWLAGVLVSSLWHLGGWLHMWRLRRRGSLLGDTTVERTWRSAAERLAKVLRLGRPVRLLRVAGPACPTVIGLLRPAVLIPAAVVTGLAPAQIEAILAHELAHIRRHDYLVNLLQVVIETLLFYHPAVWWVSGRIRAEREHACDDVAVATVGDRQSYAAALAALAEIAMVQTSSRGGALGRLASARRMIPGAGMALLGRIRRVLGLEVSTTGTARTWLTALLLAGVLTAVAATFVVQGCATGAGCGCALPETNPTALAEDWPYISVDTPGVNLKSVRYFVGDLLDPVQTGQPDRPLPDEGMFLDSFRAWEKTLDLHFWPGEGSDYLSEVNAERWHQFRELVERTVHPTEPWRSQGGWSTMEYVENTKSAIVTTTPEAQKAVAELLESLRRERGPAIHVKYWFIEAPPDVDRRFQKLLAPNLKPYGSGREAAIMGTLSVEHATAFINQARQWHIEAFDKAAKDSSFDRILMQDSHTFWNNEAFGWSTGSQKGIELPLVDNAQKKVKGIVNESGIVLEVKASAAADRKSARLDLAAYASRLEEQDRVLTAVSAYGLGSGLGKPTSGDDRPQSTKLEIPVGETLVIRIPFAKSRIVGVKPVADAKPENVQYQMVREPLDATGAPPAYLYFLVNPTLADHKGPRKTEGFEMPAK